MSKILQLSDSHHFYLYRKPVKMSLCIPVNVTTHSVEADQGYKRTKADCF